ncbi:hypothetical protein ABB37_09001 [Leptomonas pyrrhocoris]|uniref:Uncharacterized protein n=1 Tax=Leptomonas pyrrhocoris TaxID=157538 RepID=A0A0M9FRR2_LEPPY|nr:hypothetical protein ABB37_09001 [Leptomonas pyrrhocoris]XP_015653113.1 hypothetical protein ABB37_09001 [Leptomonas pyrrhocoris]KPA74673.1 hypothetical protein ABB37_09001 [Leptomonas pyrrhocoris]KPA74674.1 hypothetical protein ABB37_09001 [Leptomonas pyrrhocoris]|eukprot:XP_015653112.1 hypothetical protein ABB37_09001 [Leptomonas pyrrhocoris]
MDSAYLKNHVGAVLAKGIAETVTARPSNPQEYLALFLLHQLQEEERRVEAATRRKKANGLREDWSQQRALREKAAVDVIQHGFYRFQSRLKAKRAVEEELRGRYAEAEAEAEDLLDQEAALKESDAHHANNVEDEAHEKDAASEKLAEQEAALADARAEFFKSQRFLLQLSKTSLGQLKQELVDMSERVRMAQDVTLGAFHRAAAQESALVEVLSAQFPSAASSDNTTVVSTPEVSPAVAELAARLEEHRDHRFISVPYVNFLVLRSLCYLLLNATPKSTSTPAKVAALVKPTVMVQQLRAFNPVAGYDRGIPLKLERIVPELAAAAAGGAGGGEDGNGDDGERKNADGMGAEEGSGVSVPFRQPPTRQIRRSARVLRFGWLDGEYQCELNPEDYYTEEMVEEDAERVAAAAEGGKRGSKTGGGVEPTVAKRDGSTPSTPIPTLAEEIAAAAKARTRAAEVRATVTAQVKERGGIVLYGLLRFAAAAVAYRQARDGVARSRQELGLPADVNEEMPEEEEEDPMNDEALVDEETGEPDHAATLALQERIGVDTEEALTKIWEARDTRQQEAYAMKAAALQRQMDAGGEEEEEDAGDAE